MARPESEQIVELNDSVLTELIRESDEARRERLLETVLQTRARPVVDQVIARHTRSESIVGPEDGQDVRSNVMLNLVRKLRRVANDPGEAIEQFDDYVATLTYHAIYDVLRWKFPERTRLKNRLRYLLTRDSRFALWMHGDVLVCGLTAWLGRAPLRDEIPIPWESAPKTIRDSHRPVEALLAVFKEVGRAVRFESLLRFLIAAWRVGEGREVAVDALRDRSPSPLLRLESRQYVEGLWSEIRLLRPMQRTALLLNMRDNDGMNAVALMLLIEVATFEEIAEVAGLSPEKLSEIWASLPLEDLAIGAMLGVTRQQVINLRKSARERLARRMAARTEPRP